MHQLCTHQVAFADVPAKWPDDEAADWEALMAGEIERLRQRATLACNHVVADAAKQPLDLVRMLPCFWMVVVVRYAGKCGIAEEFVGAPGRHVRPKDRNPRQEHMVELNNVAMWMSVLQCDLMQHQYSFGSLRCLVGCSASAHGSSTKKYMLALTFPSRNGSRGPVATSLRRLNLVWARARGLMLRASRSL